MKRKYSTNTSCKGDVYEEIAEVMTVMGYPMNHTTARNVVNNVMEKIIKVIVKSHNMNVSKIDVKRMSQSPTLHDAMHDIFDCINAKRDT